MSISPCPGDFRKRVTTTGKDTFLYPVCQVERTTPTLNMTTIAGCRLQAGKTYYLNMAGYQFHSSDNTPENGLFPPTLSCESGVTTCNNAIRAE